MYAENTDRGKIVKQFYELMDKQEAIQIDKKDASIKNHIWKVELMTFYIGGIKYVLKKEVRTKITNQYRKGVLYKCGTVGESKYDMFEPSKNFNSIKTIIANTQKYLNQ